MAPDLLNSMDAEELVSLGKKIYQYQESRKLSDNKMVEKYRGLGSSKTYKRIINNDLGELSLEVQLANYRAVWAVIESLKETTSEEEQLYNDLSPALSLRRAVVEILEEDGIARFILIEGDSGTGKTQSLKLLQRQYGQRILAIEASEVWNDSPNAMLKELLNGVGIKEMPMIASDRLKMFIDYCNITRVAIAIDEGHHMGPRCLNTIKSIINQTASEVIILAMPTLWRRLERAAYEEVRQLTGNRLAERIRLDGLRENDIKKLLNRRLSKFSGNEKFAIKMLMDRAPRFGNFAFVRDVLKQAAKQADGEPVTQEIFNSAVALEMETR
jgi:DNA transposition AAA+ family ATPase